jgi:hypothetical protein
MRKMAKQIDSYYRSRDGASGRGGRNEGGTGGHSPMEGAPKTSEGSYYKDHGGSSGSTGRNKGGMSGCGLIDSTGGVKEHVK